MPTNWEHATKCTYGFITNWSTFAHELKIQQHQLVDIDHNNNNSNGNFKQTLHVPLFDSPKSTPACIFGAMVIFKPKKGDIAVLIAGKQELIDEIKCSGMVGEPLTNNITY
jgi:hypothetical protein